ncbi:GNAT family N-acetyltransferase [Rhodobacteraceae bacterium F11138]|nr:GNAT family N-acetyltransferase [Rhodobacteraceae bacterium F11138]
MSDRKPDLTRGRYHARFARDAAEIASAQALRTLCFATREPDGDRFDARCDHLLVFDVSDGALVCCCRLLQLADGGDLAQSYAAQFYDLGRLNAYPGRIVEMGRFCIHPDWQDADILRLAWGALSGLVDGNGIDLLIGCTSFPGVDPGPYENSFALLGARHGPPVQWTPRIKAPEVVRFTGRPVSGLAGAMRGIPPLLRSYLSMGGWVSDHAVIDRDLNTLHVFTGLEIKTIPEARKRLLRAVAG